MAILKTYDLKGNKLSFANWISNLSPVDTPFASMIGKEAVDQTMYQWQTDRLASPDLTKSYQEGSAFQAEILAPTTIHSNYTQILRKGVWITDTTNQVGLYGRESEKAYQMEKAAKELKRDLEWAMLHQVDKKVGAKGVPGDPRKFAGFPGLVAAQGLQCPDTGAIVHKVHQFVNETDPFREDAIFDLTYNLYLAGAKVNKIMFHPKHMFVFSNMINANPGHHVTRMFEGVDAKFNAFVKCLRDPLGQELELIPNRFMPSDKIYFFNEKDWTQMVLREPKSVELAKTGSSEKHMIEMEVGLRHSNPFASGILVLSKTGGTGTTALTGYVNKRVVAVSEATRLIIDSLKNGAVDTGDTTTLTLKVDNTSGVNVDNGAITATGITKALAAGQGGFDVKSSRPGTYIFTAEHTNGLRTAVELIVASPDRMAVAPTSEEALEEAAPVVAAKVKKAKAKAE